jgi:mRNA deadenylase 3'-5' endonuclease subunit Ccr4
MAFKALTWNILAQAYTLPKRYPLSPPEALEPGPRRALLLARLKAIDADVLCLQEVEGDSYAAICHLLGPGFHGAFAQKRGKPDGSALFLRKTLFPTARFETLHFAVSDPGYDHLALIAHTQHQGAALNIASTHLRWQRRDTPLDRNQGRAQMLELLQKLKGPRIVCGDLNALSESVVIQAATDSGLRLSCRTQRPWDTVNIDGKCRKLDYLLCSAEFSPRPGTLPRLRRDTPMPSLSEPSDHLPVTVDF